MWSFYVQMFAFLTVGIYLGDKISSGDAVIFLLSVLLTAILRKPVLKKFFSARVFILLIAVFGILSYHYAMSENVRNLYEYKDKYITAVGKIVELPKAEGKDYIYIIKVKNVNYLDKDYNPNELVRVRSDKSFKFGESIKVRGFLESFDRKLNSGDYDTPRYYKERGIYFKLYADEAEASDAKIKIYSVTYFSTWVKSKISDSIHKQYSGDEAAILKAIFTGYKDEFSDKLEERLYDTNTMRLFYPAYLHLSLLLSLIGMLSVFVKKEKRDVLFIALLCIYAIYNFNHHYIIKTAMIAAVIAYTKLKIGYSNYIEALCAICSVIFLVNPLTCYDAGFILSVSASVLIYYFVPIVKEHIKLKVSKETKRIIALWIVLTFGMLPLNAYFFNVTNPYAFLLNFLYIPLLDFLLAAVSISMVLTAITGINIFCGLPRGILYFMEWLPSAISGFPFYSIAIPRPSAVVIIIFYLCLFIVYKRMKRKKRDDFSVKTAAAVILGLSLTCIFNFCGRINDVEIDFVNVGQGDGAVISIPFRETLLIDGGGSSEYSDYDYGEKIFVPYLRRNGYTYIDAAIVSHYHSDHVKGIIAAMKKLKVKEVIMPECMEDNKYRLAIEEIAKDKDIKISFYKTGTRLRFHSGMTLSIIAPDDEDLKNENENDTSYGINMHYGNFSALFMGDLSSETELKHSGQWGDCDVLKVGHHGSRFSSCEEFLEETKPETAVISVGEGNSYSHPHDEVIKRLRDNNARIYRTDIYGNITVIADKSGEYKVYGFYG